MIDIEQFKHIFNQRVGSMFSDTHYSRYVDYIDCSNSYNQHIEINFFDNEKIQVMYEYHDQLNIPLFECIQAQGINIIQVPTIGISVRSYDSLLYYNKNIEYNEKVMKEIVWRVSKIVDQCIKAFDVMNNPARIKLFHYGLLSHQQHVNYNLEHIYVYKFGLILCEEDYYSRSEEFLNEYKYPNDIFGPRNNWFVPYGK